MMQKLDGVEDLRVRRTRKLLQQAMIEGVVEKGFAALTVRDITERAMVNRSTFYRHYLDKYDLLEQHMNEMYMLLEEHGRGLIEPGHHEGLVELLRQVQRFPDFYRAVFGPQADALLSRHFRQQTEQRFLTCFQHAFPEAASRPDVPPLDLKFNTVASAGCGALIWWLGQERPSTPEQFASWLHQLIYDISVSAFKQGPAGDRKSRTLP
ncbi:TetR family transcriptional regulator [Reticulibacter mediterranei]|uniref:TetR family transcriptional regulator n=1 Tax=Reticulibacter mediterranei TaxID=2778369 RepID=A0A8J3IPW6_9CHLR|nr:TetR/AcrR family transcriptional regulator [Reticulibacter mediterranei]GHO97998.1 TetR family transcriptional regulator [Reticulibacter mediterranei]